MDDRQPQFEVRTSDWRAVMEHLIENSYCSFDEGDYGHHCEPGECPWQIAVDAARRGLFLPEPERRPDDEPEVCPWCREDAIEDSKHRVVYVCGTRLGKSTKYAERSLPCRAIEGRL